MTDQGKGPSMPAIEVHALTLRYGRTVALQDVSLAVKPGTVYALLGRNGAGKSSLLRALLGLMPPHQGSVVVMGQDPWRARAAALAEVGVVPEEDDAPADVPLRDLALLHARLFPRWDQAAFDARAGAWGLDPRKPTRRMSKGQRKLAQLALALGHQPSLLLLDDPTLGLDAVARRQVFDEVVGSLAERGMTVLLTTHDLHGVEGLADRVGVLDHGRLVLDDDLEALRARWRRLSLHLAPGADPTALQTALTALGPTDSQRLGRQLELTLSGWDEAHWRAALPAVEPLLAEPPAPPPALSLEEIFLALCGGEA